MRNVLFAMSLFLAPMAWTQDWQWSRQIGGPGGDLVYLGFTDTDSNVYVYGNYARDAGGTDHADCYIDGDTLFGSQDAFLAKYESNGTLSWVRECSSPNGLVAIHGMALDTANETFYIVGEYTWSFSLDTCSLTAPFAGAFLSKWNLDGHCLWARNVATNAANLDEYSCQATAVTLDQLGNVFIGGNMAPYGPTSLAGVERQPGSFLVAYDDAGDTLWTKVLATYTGITRMVRPLYMRRWQDQLVVFNQFFLNNTTDTIAIDTFQVTGAQGAGYALFSLDVVSDEFNWVKYHGLPNAPTGIQAPQHMYLDATGGIYVAGAYVTSAIFGDDTLNSGTSVPKGFLVRYDDLGAVQFTREFEASQGVNFTGISGGVDGLLSLTGYVWGSLNWDGVELSTAGDRHLFVSAHSANGDCLDAQSTGIGAGVTIARSGTDLYVTGVFAAEINPPFSSLSIGADTYVTYGWSDAVIAKHELLTNIVPNKSPEHSALVIYANPNHGSFRVVLPEVFFNEPHLHMRLYDATGKQIQSQAVGIQDTRPQMDVLNANSGLYMVTVSNGKAIYSGCVVVE